MVPGCAELCSLQVVDLGCARCDRAFGDTVDTIVEVAAQLAETVPVNGGTVGLHVVLDGDLEVVTPVGTDQRTRVLAVDQQTTTAGGCAAIRVAGSVGDCEGVLVIC